MIPAELKTLCLSGINPTSDEGRVLLPPRNICIQVVLAYETGKPSPELVEWVKQQEALAAEAAQLVDLLPAYDGTNLPGWMGTSWAIQLGCPWGAGLSEAVQEAKQWLSLQ
jgi:hypothetical protein